MKKNSRINNKNGISLIILIITIIVIVILAGAVILSVINSNIISSAENAAKSQFKDSLISSYSIITITKFSENNGDKSKIKISMQDLIDAGFTQKDIDSNNVSIDENYNLKINDEIIASIGSSVSSNAIPAPEGGSVFKDQNGKYVPVPKDFKVLENFNIVANGLVIEDISDDITTKGNQFVWIPALDNEYIADAKGYSRRAFTINDKTQVLSENGSGTNYEQYTELEEYKEILASVGKYKGFYIGRFEAGIATNMPQVKPTSDTTSLYASNNTYKPVSKQDAFVWNYIKFSTNGMNDITGSGNGALKVSHNTYNNKNSVYSTLIYPQAWDTALQFIAKTDPVYPVNSTGSGNYSDNNANNNPARSGDTSYPQYVKNNIYDMAGNVLEWTMETYNSSNHTSRSACYGDTGNLIPAASRRDYLPSNSNDYMGFRLQLYIK